tara:strand:- start:8299 stop:8763 length:465 start_codon:yes stop_codon:yes gene_type:complete
MYDVGDIIWIVNSSYPGVKPYQVVEETTHKTLNGTLKTFYVRCPNADGVPVALSELDGDVFTDVEEVEKYLNSKASAAIGKMLSRGKLLIAEHFTQTAVQEEPSTDIDSIVSSIPENPIGNSNLSSVDQLGSEEDFLVLPDGTKARINIKGNIL